MTRWEQMMPMSPSALADRLVRVVARFDLHVGNPSVSLPLGKVLADKFLNRLLTLQVGLGDVSKFVIELLPGSRWLHPMYGIKALLKDVIVTRFKVCLVPSAELITCASCRGAEVATQRRNFGSIFMTIYGVEEVGVLSPAIRPKCAR